MLTPYLESLIHAGKAMYKTNVMGLGQATAIVIPQNSYAVITDILYYPYIDADQFTGPPTELYNTNGFNNQVWIRSRLGNNHYVFRPEISDLHVDGGTSFPAISPIQVNTYLVHDGVIRFTCSMMDNPNVWISVDNNPLQDISNEESAGIGSAGIAPGYNTIRSVQFSNNQWYNVPTNVRNNPGAGKEGGDQYRQNPSANQLGSKSSSIYSFPVINIGYVQIQGKPSLLTS